jgi:hypothetical protein
MDVRTREQAWRRWLSANDTSASFPSRIPTLTPPTDTTDALRTLEGGPNIVRVDVLGADTLELMPYGAGADDTNFNLRVIGWRCIAGIASTDSALWIPSSLCTLACTLGTTVGVAATPVVAANRFADVISVTDGLAVTPGVPDNMSAIALVSLSGFMGLELIFNMNSSATSGNALFAMY